MSFRLYLPSPERPGQVLLVDDDARDRRLIAAHLESGPFVLTEARSAEEALALCRARTFEAILSDMSMPGISGLEFSRGLRGTLNRLTPLVFLSGLPQSRKAADDWMEAGALDFLQKPCSGPELLAKLQVMVRLSRQQTALAASERKEALLEIAGGAAHELSQPLAAAQLLLDRLERQHEAPTPEQMGQLRDLLDRTSTILSQIKGLQTYVTRPYPTGRIMDIERSAEASGSHAGYDPAERKARG
jgi:CheY-like chemotaxis protein